MADNRKRNPRQEVNSRGLRRGSRGGRIFLVLMEMVMAAVLALAVYAVNILGSMELASIAEQDIYSYQGNSGLVVKALNTAPAPVEEEIPETEEKAATAAQVIEELQQPEYRPSRKRRVDLVRLAALLVSPPAQRFWMAFRRTNGSDAAVARRLGTTQYIVAARIAPRAFAEFAAALGWAATLKGGTI